MWETLKIIGVLLYSQVTPYLSDWIKYGDFHKITNPSFDKSIDYIVNIGFFHVFQSVLYEQLPCKKVYGCKTKAGNTPDYNDNGLYAWFLTAFLEIFWLSEMYTKEERAELFDNLGDFQKCLNFYGIFISLCVYVWAIFSNKESLNEPIITGNPIKDFFKGIELHPKNKFGDIKLVINSRVGMMLWGNIVILAMMASDSTTVLVSGILQLIYITKFFIWESGYVKTTDITLDRCGYYLFWGCISYIPSVYTSPIVYHYYHYHHVEKPFATLSVYLGTLFIFINWVIDRNRLDQRSRKEKGEDVKGVLFISAPYKTEDGKENQGWLIASGWLGLASNITYFFEISASLMWTLAGVIPTGIFCYTYVIYLTVLLVHRTYRIDKKCSEKYGEAWKKYRSYVPYKIIPGIF